MAWQFTPAARRALDAATHWTSSNDFNGIAPAELLMGLLAETECRAAAMLAAQGIEAPAVRQRWPELRFSDHPPPQRADEFSAEVHAIFEAAAARLADYPPPVVLATEHLLLGLLASYSEVSQWLGEHGLAAEPLEAEIHRLAGHESGPLPLEFGEQENSPAMQNADFAKPQHSAEHWEAASARGAAGVSITASRPATTAATERTSLLRIVDAAANRAREGLRVLEDFVRFAQNGERLTNDLKQLRHALAAELARFDPTEFLAARDTLSDIGTQLTAEGERRRVDLTSVARANFKRLQESLRSLEEFGKALDADFGAAMKQLRYRTYTLERDELAPRSRPQAQIERARLYVLVDGGSSFEEFTRLVRSLVESGTDVIQLRDKRLDDRQLLQRARGLRAITREAGVLFIMNDRADLALLAEADGVHVGQDELSVAEARAIVGPSALVGVSTHSLSQARQAECDGADYLGIGPTFASATKPFAETELTGVELLRAVAAEIRTPAFAIGGIHAGNLADVLASGISRIAVSGAVLAAPDPAAATRQLSVLLGDAARAS